MPVELVFPVDMHARWEIDWQGGLAQGQAEFTQT